ncbi:hypothetical protein OC845_006400 [Tilletia horrida]|nr:hypothetical protein OC845_006400 [Tilletia horrida]
MCLSAICMASPDLFVDSTKDYILYAVDAVENHKAAVAANLKRAAAAAATTSTSSSSAATLAISSSPVSSSKQGSSSRSVLAGKGYLSRALEEPGHGHTTVNGRIVGGMNSFQGAGGYGHFTGSDEEDEDEEEDEETLEVVLRLKEVERASRDSHLSMLGNLQQPTPAVQASSIPSGSSLLPLPSTSHLAPGNITRAVSDPNVLSTSSNHGIYAPPSSSSVNSMGPPASTSAAFDSSTMSPWPTSAPHLPPAAPIAAASNPMESSSTRASTPATGFDLPASSSGPSQQAQQNQLQPSSAPSPKTQAQLLNLLMLLQQRQPNVAAAAAGPIRTDSVVQQSSGSTTASAIDSFSSLFGIAHVNGQPAGSSSLDAAVGQINSNSHPSSSAAALCPAPPSASSITAPTPDGGNAGLIGLLSSSSSPHPMSVPPLPSQPNAADAIVAHQPSPVPHPFSNMPNLASGQSAQFQSQQHPHQPTQSQHLSPLPPPFSLHDPVRPNQPLLPLSSSGGKSSPPKAGSQGESNATAHFGSAPSSSAKRGSLDAIAEQKSRKLRRKVALSSVAAGTMPAGDIPAAFAMPTASSGFHGLGGLGASVSLGSSAYHPSGPLPRATTTQVASSRAGSVDGDGASVASGKSELKAQKYKRRAARESAAAAAAAAVAERDRAESLAGGTASATVTTRKRSRLKDGSDSYAPSEAGSVLSSSSKKNKSGNKPAKKKKDTTATAASSQQAAATLPASARPAGSSAATVPRPSLSSPESLKELLPSQTAIEAGAVHHDHSLRSASRNGAPSSIPHIAFPLSSPIRHSSSHRQSSLHSDATTKVAGSSMSTLTTPLNSSSARFAFPKHLLQSSPGTAFDTLLSEGDLDFDGFGLPHNLFGSPGIMQHHGERLGGHGTMAGHGLTVRHGGSSGRGGLDSEGHQPKSRSPSTPRRRSPRKNPAGTHASMNPYASTNLEADLFGDEGESPLFGFVNMSPASEPMNGGAGAVGSSGSRSSLRRSGVLGGGGATPGSTADRDDDNDGMGGDVFGSPSAHRAQRRQPRGSSQVSSASTANHVNGPGGDEQVLHPGVTTAAAAKVVTVATGTAVVAEQAKTVPASPRPHTRSMSSQGTHHLMSNGSLSALNLSELLQANLSPTGRGKSSTIEHTPSVSGSGGAISGGKRLSNELKDLLTGSPRGRVRVTEAL